MRFALLSCLLTGLLFASVYGAEFQVNTHVMYDQKNAAIAAAWTTRVIRALPIRPIPPFSPPNRTTHSHGRGRVRMHGHSGLT